MKVPSGKGSFVLQKKASDGRTPHEWGKLMRATIAGRINCKT